MRQALSRERGIERMRAEREDILLKQRDGHLGAVSAVGLRLKADAHKSAVIARAENAEKCFGDRVLFSHAALHVRGGEHVAIVGSNGCGKTTLLRMLLGEDQDFTGLCQIGSWVKTALLDQNAVFENERLTMIEQASLAPRIQNMAFPEDGARELLARLGFYGEECEKEIAVLSGGERVRLKLAMMLADEPQCLVLDEPTNHLDLPAREAVERAVRDFEGTVIAVSHDRYFLTHCVDRIIAFENGALRSYDGNWEAYIASTCQEAPVPESRGRRVARKTPKKQNEPETGLQLEARIQELETQRACMEAHMTPEADRTLYDEYSALLYELDALYTEWEEQE